MKTVDLSKGQPSLSELLTLAKTGRVIIHSMSGEDFEQADEFDREVAALGSSEKFGLFLEARARENEEVPLAEVRENRGI